MFFFKIKLLVFNVYIIISKSIYFKLILYIFLPSDLKYSQQFSLSRDEKIFCKASAAVVIGLIKLYSLSYDCEKSQCRNEIIELWHLFVFIFMRFYKFQEINKTEKYLEILHNIYVRALNYFIFVWFFNKFTFYDGKKISQWQSDL